MVFVVFSGKFLRNTHQFAAHNLQSLVLKAGQDSSHEVALHGVWLENDQCCFHEISFMVEVVGEQMVTKIFDLKEFPKRDFKENALRIAQASRRSGTFALS